jgi:hypothetical protein
MFPFAALRSTAWFDDATLDVPAEGYFFGFNLPGPNPSGFDAPTFGAVFW